MSISSDEILSPRQLKLNEINDFTEKESNQNQTTFITNEQMEIFSYSRILNNPNNQNKSFISSVKKKSHKIFKEQNLSNKIIRFSIERKDAKGIPILKKNKNNNIINHHVSFIDTVDKNQQLVEVIKVKSYKNYNKSENPYINKCIDMKKLSNVVNIDKCCLIF